MNMKHKLATLVILGVLLESCSNGSQSEAAKTKDGDKSTVLNDKKDFKKSPFNSDGKLLNTLVTYEINSEGKFFSSAKNDSKDFGLKIQKTTTATLDKGDTRLALLSIDPAAHFTLKGESTDSISVKELILSKDSIVNIGKAKSVLGTVCLQKGSVFSKDGDSGVIDFEDSGQGSWKNPRADKEHIHQIHGTFEPDFIVRKDFTLYSSGTFGGNLTNEGNFVLKQSLIPEVKGTFVNKGTITVTLTDRVADWKKFLVAKAITLGGSLRVYGGEKDCSYKLFSSVDGITGKFDNIEGASEENFTDKDKDFNVKAKGLVSKPVSNSHASSSLNHVTSVFSAHSRNFVESAFSGVDSMHSAEKTSLGYGMSVTSLSKGQENFFGLNAGNSGLYVNYENLNNMDFGAYSIASIGEFKMLNSVAFAVGDKFSDAHSAGEVKKNFFQISSQIGKTFAVENFKITPKMMASISNFLSLEGNLQIGDDAFFIDGKSKASFSAGIGMDLVSNFKVAAIPVEAFASFDLTNATGHGVTMTNGDQVVTSASGIAASCKLGFTAQTSQDSKFYSNVNLTSDENSSLELGFNIKM